MEKGGQHSVEEVFRLAGHDNLLGKIRKSTNLILAIENNTIPNSEIDRLIIYYSGLPSAEYPIYHACLVLKQFRRSGELPTPEEPLKKF